MLSALRTTLSACSFWALDRAHMYCSPDRLRISSGSHSHHPSCALAKEWRCGPGTGRRCGGSSTGMRYERCVPRRHGTKCRQSQTALNAVLGSDDWRRRGRSGCGHRMDLLRGIWRMWSDSLVLAVTGRRRGCTVVVVDCLKRRSSSR